MKKTILTVAVAGFIALGFTSCKKEQCVECTNSGQSTTICEEDYTAVGGVSWATYRDALAANPNCKKVNK